MDEPRVFGAGSSPAWIPDAATIERSRLLTAMRRWGFSEIEQLHDASIANPEWFWGAVLEDIGIEFTTPYARVLDETDGKPFPRWFGGGGLNIATLCAHRHATGPLANNDAVVFEGDDGQRRSLTFAELDRDVRQFAANLL